MDAEILFQNTKDNAMFYPRVIIEQAVSPFDTYCDGFKSPGASGSGCLSALILSVGMVSCEFSHPGSQVLDSILAYDQSEAATAYIGQINMTIVSSFLGPQGLIWGYDLARSEGFELQPKLFCTEKKHIPVYSAQMLIDAARCLFGVRNEKHFPFIPGSHVPCAGRYDCKAGPAHIYCAIAIGVPEHRSESAVIFMEDVGQFTTADFHAESALISKNMANSVSRIGDIQGIDYKEIFVGMRDIVIHANEIGCALVAMPYFTLARNALAGIEETEILGMTLQNWEKTCQHYFLSARKCAPVGSR